MEYAVTTAGSVHFILRKYLVLLIPNILQKRYLAFVLLNI